jgi:hypothetical protein
MILPLTTHGRGDVKVSEMGSNRAGGHPTRKAESHTCSVFGAAASAPSLWSDSASSDF